MTTSPRPSVTRHLARQARELFVNDLDALIVQLMSVIQEKLAGVNGTSGLSIQDMHLAMDASMAFQSERQNWVSAARAAWRRALDAVGVAGEGESLQAGLGLVDDEVVERKILASRLSLAVSDKAGSEINDLRLRILHLEQRSELHSNDVFKPEMFARTLIQAWTDCGLTRPMWMLVQDAVRVQLALRMVEAYQKVNVFLIEQGVMPRIDFKHMVRRTEDAGAGTRARAGAPDTGNTTGWGDVPGADEGPASGAGWGDRPGATAGGWPARAAPAGQRPPASPWGTARAPLNPTATRLGAGADSMFDAHAVTRQDQALVRPSALARAQDETRMMTAGTPMMRMRQRAQGVLGQLRRMLSDRVADFDPAQPIQASPALAKALIEHVTPFATTQLLSGSEGEAVSAPVNVIDAAQQLRKRATGLKAKAEKQSEKATIEIVALMFQAILAEERIAAAIRVWFARLQIPVLRLALAEPEFFASVQHPARQLIDRMGACAMGFDAGAADARLEREIKRVVQVIEQYPETGRRVYQLVLDEFKKFLGRSLADGSDAVRQAVTLAQQVEQKEALSIQYTIELRKMLASMPVGDEIREFLFRVWSEVLAMAAVRHGPQHEQTLRFKKAAADLLWAVSPKPQRSDRARVIQELPPLLAVLREGMGTLALDGEAQDGHVKLINDTVGQAFLARGDGIDPAQLEELAHGLAALEDVVTDDPEGDVMLDPDSIEMMAGVDASALVVIAEGGSQPSPGILAWAQELELGHWFSLDHGGSQLTVQYLWRSARGQLHLFGSSAGQSYLVQTRRLASYLQAGLLVPMEDETLTVRATRDALAKLDAEPDRLLQ